MVELYIPRIEHISHMYRNPSTEFDAFPLIQIAVAAFFLSIFSCVCGNGGTEILLQHNIKFNLINDCEMDQTHKIDHITEITRAFFFPDALWH